MDSWQNAWTAAKVNGSSFIGTSEPLQAGFHVLYAYAVDGQAATSTEAGSPQIGAVQAYGFFVTVSTTITALAGTPQTASIGDSFAGVVEVSVTDLQSNPVSGVPVTFSAPVSGASASFAGATSVVAVTNAEGIASSPRTGGERSSRLLFGASIRRPSCRFL